MASLHHLRPSSGTQKKLYQWGLGYKAESENWRNCSKLAHAHCSLFQLKVWRYKDEASEVWQSPLLGQQESPKYNSSLTSPPYPHTSKLISSGSSGTVQAMKYASGCRHTTRIRNSELDLPPHFLMWVMPWDQGDFVREEAPPFQKMWDLSLLSKDLKTS